MKFIPEKYLLLEIIYMTCIGIFSIIIFTFSSPCRIKFIGPPSGVGDRQPIKSNIAQFRGRLGANIDTIFAFSKNQITWMGIFLEMRRILTITSFTIWTSNVSRGQLRSAHFKPLYRMSFKLKIISDILIRNRSRYLPQVPLRTDYFSQKQPL